MMTFKLIESNSNLSSLYDSMRKEPYFVFVMGATGAGKNFIVRRNFPGVPLVDIDKYMAEMASKEPDKTERDFISKAVHKANKELKKFFEKGKSVIQTGTGGNLKGLENKLKLAKSYGMKTALILVDTDIKKAKERNLQRAENGEQRLVPEWKIDVSYKKSAENYETLKNTVDFSSTIFN